MLKLMKYEFRKTGFSKLILLVVTLVAELAFLLGVFLEKDRLLCSDWHCLYRAGKRAGAAPGSEYEAELYVVPDTAQQL